MKRLGEETIDPSIWQEAMGIANTCYDGHLTLFRFTTNWKAAFRTVTQLHPPILEDLENGWENPAFVTGTSINGVLTDLIANHNVKVEEMLL